MNIQKVWHTGFWFFGTNHSETVGTNAKIEASKQCYPGDSGFEKIAKASQRPSIVAYSSGSQGNEYLISADSLNLSQVRPGDNIVVGGQKLSVEFVDAGNLPASTPSLNVNLHNG